LKHALIDLYLSVKIRKNEEIERYNEETLANERNNLIKDEITCLDLVHYIQTSIEILMKLKNEKSEQKMVCKKCKLNLKEIFDKKKNAKEQENKNTLKTQIDEMINTSS